MKLAAATAVALMMIAAPAFADPPRVSTACAVAPLDATQQAAVYKALGEQPGPTATAPGNFGGLNPYARDAGFQNAAQAAKFFGFSPSQVNEQLHDCRGTAPN